MTTDEFNTRVESWLANARHPRFYKQYDQLTYQPMQEVLRYLRANGFKTFIVSGGGADFMRVWSERVYGIPPEQVVGSASRTGTSSAQAGRAGQDARFSVRGRQGGQARRHSRIHRASPDCRLWQ